MREKRMMGKKGRIGRTGKKSRGEERKDERERKQKGGCKVSLCYLLIINCKFLLLAPAPCYGRAFSTVYYDTSVPLGLLRITET
jgi:hypothetical protein